jgi:hypothetical protein
MDLNDTKKVAKGAKLEVLCNDGRHYHAEVREIGGDARIHFRNYSERNDCIGPLASMYIAPAGTFSAISDKYDKRTQYLQDLRGTKTR